MIKAIIGLGNPGSAYYRTRHSIGFRVLDAIADTYSAQWRTKDQMETTSITIDGHDIVLVKPQTFMNTSGKVIPSLLKKGIKPQEIIVVHDELEVPFGQVKMRVGGSHKGHNGLRSIIEACGPDFIRMRFGIERPANKEHVPNYVLENFTPEQEQRIKDLISAAVDMLIAYVKASGA